MRSIALTLAAGHPYVSSGMLVAEFVVVSVVAAIYTMVKAKKGKDRSPVKLGLVLGPVVGLMAVGLTAVATSSTNFFG